MRLHVKNNNRVADKKPIDPIQGRRRHRSEIGTRFSVGHLLSLLLLLLLLPTGIFRFRFLAPLRGRYRHYCI